MSKPKHIFLVDDEDVFRFLVKKTINKTEFIGDTMEFGNGLMCLEYLREHAMSEDLLPEIIFLDLSMPVMDGWDFLEAFRKLKASIKKKIAVYIMSSSISPDDMNRAKESEDVSGFLIKPITAPQLQKVIQEVEATAA